LKIDQDARATAVQTVPLGLVRSALLAIFVLFSISRPSAARLFLTAARDNFPELICL